MNENNIIIKITSEADLSDAQLQMRELTEKARQYEEQMKALTKSENEEMEAVKARVKTGKEDASILEDVTRTYREKKKVLSENITANKRNIESIRNEVKAYNQATSGGKRMSATLEDLRDRLSKLEEAGDATSDEFINLSIQAAKLQDQIGDTQQRISILASDTMVLDAAMSAGSGLTGAFTTATSAMSLLGGESEDLEKAFYKAQASITMLNGVQSVANALNKDSAINVALSTKMHSLQSVALAKEAVAAGTATKAQKLLNAVMKLNPFGLILTAITAVISLFMVFGGELEEIGRKIRALFDGIAGFFSKSYEANRKAQIALENYEKTQTRVNMRLNYLNIKHAEDLHAIDEAEKEALTSAKKRHAGTLEMSKIELKYLKNRRDETLKYVNEAIKANNVAVEQAKNVVVAKKAALAQAKGVSKVTEATKELEEAQKTYYDLVQAGIDLDEQRNSAKQSVIDAEQNIANERIAIRRQTEQVLIDTMADGMDKELKQLKFNYEQQLKEAGNNKALRKAIEDKMGKEETEIRRRYAIEASKQYVESLRIEADADQFNLEKRMAYYHADADAKLTALDENKRGTQEYANAEAEIYDELANRINSINEQMAANLTSQYELAVKKAQDVVNDPMGGEKFGALDALYEAQTALFGQQKAELEQLYSNSTISYQEYSDRLYEIEKSRIDAEIALQQEKMQIVADTFSQTIETIQGVSDVVFEAIGVATQKQMDDLEKYYTTDAEEAAKDANKKYLTEKQYEKKKAELQLKQQRMNKASAIFNILISTAQAIMTTLAQLGATPWGISSAAIAGAMGAAQVAVASAKPLPQYAKGRKGGQGEYALVGEKGPELMYVPSGASIVPNDKLNTPELWSRFGVPELPFADTLKYTPLALSIDYEKLGRAVAGNIPQQKQVVVNVDKNGVTVTNGLSTRTYANAKYSGQWR